jgi:hypothetical protein
MKARLVNVAAMTALVRVRRVAMMAEDRADLAAHAAKDKVAAPAVHAAKEDSAAPGAMTVVRAVTTVGIFVAASAVRHFLHCPKYPYPFYRTKRALNRWHDKSK